MSHLFESIDIKADLIMANPPIRAGKQTVFNLYEQAQKHLNEGGKLVVVIQKNKGHPQLLKSLKHYLIMLKF